MAECSQCDIELEETNSSTRIIGVCKKCDEKEMNGEWSVWDWINPDEE